MNIYDTWIAYQDCLRHKRGTTSAMEFSLNWMAECADLTESVNARTYHPSTSVCFVVTKPKLREVFAANFRDRVLHHYVSLRLEPLFERVFSDRTFNCRKGKGLLYGIRCLERDIRACSENYTRDCWIMKLDLKGFFMSIDKAILLRKIDDFVVRMYHEEDVEDVRFLCRTFIMHQPQFDCIKQSPQALFDLLPDHKTKFRAPLSKSVELGNIFSQIFANFLLNDFDWFIERNITPYHGRYVDDIYLISQDKGKLLSAVPMIRAELALIGLELNEKKFYLQHYSKGVKFTGAVVKPGRTYTGNRTVGGFVNSVRALNRACSMKDITHAVQSVNSYLGFLRQHDSYAIRRKYLSQIDARLFEYIYIKGHYETVVIKQKYRI